MKNILMQDHIKMTDYEYNMKNYEEKDLSQKIYKFQNKIILRIQSIITSDIMISQRNLQLIESDNKTYQFHIIPIIVMISLAEEYKVIWTLKDADNIIQFQEKNNSNFSFVQCICITFILLKQGCIRFIVSVLYQLLLHPS
ncbi:unnamed protein product [Paramecium octaurelia]|uniref:Uncharacterized protein n=1 Tax=Paramecium octaurelia TaxID=43137 RepID=A0A8S1X002_PAROT|nr:unnamed protein product [Paramecium octaurelia]